jgi:hypothetical protein
VGLILDKETLEKLLDDKPKEIRSKAILLFNGTAICAKAYQDEPSSVNRRNWEDSEEALSKFVEQIGAADGEEEDKPLRNIAAVLDYLRAGDWRVTKTSLYRHQKEGKIAPRRDGLYTLRDVDKYARTWLKQKSTGKKIQEKTEEQQRKKLDLELRNLELENKRKTFAYDKDLERYIPKEFMEIELAGRAGVLDAGLKHWVQSRAAEWIRTVGGDTKKVGDLIVLMNRDLDEHINSYASSLSYQVVIDAEEEATGEAPETEPETEEKDERGE